MRFAALPRSLVVLLAATLARADDAADLVRRAEARLSQDERADVRGLFEQALGADPTCGRALAWLAEHEFGGVRSRARFLLTARPLDLPTARKTLESLERDLAGPPEELHLAAERATLLPTESAQESLGPLMPWERSLETVSWTPPCGPLRGEAFGTGVLGHLELLHAVRQRFIEDGVADAACWARLAVLFRRLADRTASDEAFRRAIPVSPDEWIGVAECALRLLEDPASWWELHGPEVLAGLRSHALTDEAAPDPGRVVGAVKPLLASRRDIVGLAALAEVQTLYHPLLDHVDPFGDALSATCAWMTQEEVFARLEREAAPACVCMRARALMGVGRSEEGVRLLEESVRRAPDSIAAWSLLHWYATRTFKREEARQARHGLIQACLQASKAAARHRWEVERDLDLVADGDAQALDRLVSREMEKPGWVARLADIEGPRERRTEVLDALVEGGRRSRALDDRCVASILRLAIHLDRVDAAFDLTRRLARFSRGARSRFGQMDGFGYQDWELHGAISFLRCCAAERSLTEPQDLLLRSFVDKVHHGARSWTLAQMAMDDRFQALPGAPYVEALFREGFHDARVPSGLRKRAHGRGFRAPHLLRQMAFEGAPVLEELRRFDPDGARLIGAQRAGAEALRRLLEDIDLPEEHRRLADAALRRVPADGPQTPGEAASPGETARRLLAVLHADPRTAIDVDRWHGHGLGWGSINQILAPLRPPPCLMAALGALPMRPPLWDVERQLGPKGTSRAAATPPPTWVKPVEGATVLWGTTPAPRPGQDSPGCTIEEWIRAAGDESLSEDRRAALYRIAATRACEAERVDLLLAAVVGGWENGLPLVNDGETGNCVSGLFPIPEPMLKAIRPLLPRPHDMSESPIWIELASQFRPERWEALRDDRARLGWVYEGDWLGWMVALPASKLRQEFELSLRPDGPTGRRSVHELVPSLVRALVEAGRDEEAIECAHLAAEARGWDDWCLWTSDRADAPVFAHGENEAHVRRRPLGRIDRPRGARTPPPVREARLLESSGLAGAAVARLCGAPLAEWSGYARDEWYRTRADLALRNAYVVLRSPGPWWEEPRNPDEARHSAAIQDLAESLWDLWHRGTDPCLACDGYRLAAEFYENVSESRAHFVRLLVRDFGGRRDAEPGAIAKWSGKLGVDDIASRERTQVMLGAQGVAAVPLVLELMKSADPEVAIRAREVLEFLARP